MSKFVDYIISNKEYATLYNTIIAIFTLIFSIISFFASNIISHMREKKERQIFKERNDEQKRQYEERLAEERKRRIEDKKEADEKNRISEKPYLVFKKSEVVSSQNSDQVVLRMEFINKGRGSAYDIIPDIKCKGEILGKEEFLIYRYGAVEDPIAMIGETFAVFWSYQHGEIETFRMNPVIKFKDASGRDYKQQYNIDIIDRIGNANIINYAQPRLCEY